MNQIEVNNAAEETDTLGRFGFAKRLTAAIDVDFNIQAESYVLLLTGSYGSGKTTFLQMWSRDLHDLGCKVAKINAWETGFEESPQ